MLRMAGATSYASLHDLMRAVVVPEPRHFLRAFNPYLSDKTCDQLREAILLWLQLCVLEDRLERLHHFSQGDKELIPMLMRVSTTRVHDRAIP